jgi:hypothetical protein
MKPFTIQELEDKISMAEMRIQFITSCVSLLLSEANHLDHQATQLLKEKEIVEVELRDLKAQLSDTK